MPPPSGGGSSPRPESPTSGPRPCTRERRRAWWPSAHARWSGPRPSPPSSVSSGAHDSYESLVADPEVDAVYVASPHSEHHDHSLLALAAGKPVLVEKAFTRNAVEAAAVIDEGPRPRSSWPWSRRCGPASSRTTTSYDAPSTRACSARSEPSRPTTASCSRPTDPNAWPTPRSPAVRAPRPGHLPGLLRAPGARHVRRGPGDGDAHHDRRRRERDDRGDLGAGRHRHPLLDDARQDPLRGVRSRAPRRASRSTVGSTSPRRCACSTPTTTRSTATTRRAASTGWPTRPPSSPGSSPLGKTELLVRLPLDATLRDHAGPRRGTPAARRPLPGRGLKPSDTCGQQHHSTDPRLRHDRARHGRSGCL